MQLTTLADYRAHIAEEEHENEDVAEDLGRGFPQNDEKKMGYMRQKGNGDRVYIEANDHSNTNVCSSLTGSRGTELEAMYCQVASFIIRPIDEEMSVTEAEASLLTTGKKALLPPITILFFSLYVLHGGKEGSIGYSMLSLRFGILNITVALYIRHVGKALLDVLHDGCMSFIRCTDASERQGMREIVFGFQKCTGLLD